MTKLLWFATAAIAYALTPNVAHAATGECRLVQFSAPSLSVVYDPFDVYNAGSPVAIVARTGGDCRGARIQLAVIPSTTSPQTGSTATLVQGNATLSAAIEIGGQQRPIGVPGAAFINNPISIPLGSAGEVASSGTMTINLDSGQVAPPGTYTALLTLLAQVTDATGNQTTSEAPLVLSAFVKPSVRVAVGAGDLRIDLGELKPGTIGGPVNFDAYSNVDYSLRLQSDNGFVMRLSGHGTAPGVPYVPMIGGEAVEGSNTGVANVRQIVFGSPSGGVRHHALRVRVDQFVNLTAGAYSDVMTVEIRARV